MKIVYLGRYNRSEILSGPEKVAKRLYPYMHAINKDIHFIEYFFDGREYGIFRKLFGHERFVDNNLDIKRFGIFPILLFLFRYKPDIIHLVTFERFAICAFLYKFFFNTKIIYTAHGIVTYENHKLKKGLSFIYKLKDDLFEKIIYKYSDKIVFPSNVYARFAENYYKPGSKKQSAIANGVDDIFTPVNHRQGNDILKMLFIGSVDRSEKGFAFLIDTLADVDFKVDLYIISDADVNIDCPNPFVNIDVVKKMDTNDYNNFLIDKDIFVSTSFVDSFSISAAEAIAAGLFPLITYETGISEYLNIKRDLFLFNYGDKNKLKELLTTLNNNRELITSTSEELRKNIEGLRWVDVAAKYYQTYQGMLYE